MTFQIKAISAAPFTHLFQLSDEALKSHLAVRVIADSHPGYPCRVSLEDASIGETLLLIHYQHHSAATPYRASHAIYIRENARQAKPEPGEIPDVLKRRLISLRAFDQSGQMIEADVAKGPALADALEAMFQQALVAEVHLHNAKQGCYAAKAVRV
jgi:hypothetical protein